METVPHIHIQLWIQISPISFILQETTTSFSINWPSQVMSIFISTSVFSNILHGDKEIEDSPHLFNAFMGSGLCYSLHFSSISSKYLFLCGCLCPIKRVAYRIELFHRCNSFKLHTDYNSLCEIMHLLPHSFCVYRIIYNWYNNIYRNKLLA